MITDTINRFPIEFREEAHTYCKKLSNDIQTELNNGKPLNLEKLNAYIIEEREKINSSKEFDVISNVRYHLFRQLRNDYYNNKIVVQQVNELFPSSTLQAEYFANLQTYEYKENRFIYIAPLRNRIPLEKYKALCKLAEQHRGKVNKKPPYGFTFINQQDAINFLNINTDAKQPQQQSVRTDDTKITDGRTSDRVTNRDTKMQREDIRRIQTTDVDGLYEGTDRQGSRKNQEGSIQTSILNNIAFDVEQKSNNKESIQNIRETLLLPEFVSLNSPEYIPGVSAYNADKHLEYVVKNNIELHLQKMQECILEDLKLSALEQAQPTINFSPIRNKGIVDYELQVSNNKKVNLFIRYNLVSGKDERDIYPLRATQIFIEEMDGSNSIVLTPPFYYQELLKVITNNYSQEAKETLEQSKQKPVLSFEENFALLKEKYKGDIILFRKDDMYISYFDDAKKVQEILGQSAFYHFELDNNLPKLIRAGLKIILHEEVFRENPLDFGENAYISAKSEQISAQENFEPSTTEEELTTQAQKEGKEVAQQIINNETKEEQEKILNSEATKVELTKRNLDYRNNSEETVKKLKAYLEKKQTITKTIADNLGKTTEQITNDNKIDPYTPVYETIEKEPIQNKKENEEEVNVMKNITHTSSNINDNNYIASFDATEFSTTERIHSNFNAIELLQKLEFENRDVLTEPLTEQEKNTLARFSGWGGLSEAFNEKYKTWGDSGKRIETLFDNREDYVSARDSRHTAFYTPQYINEQLWQIARLCGFKGGKILEGSAGVGGILSAMPLDMRNNSQIDAVEIDNISAKILKYLHPGANVMQQGFEKTFIPNGSVDLAITNVPFATNYKVFDKVEKDLSTQFSSLHDFCIAKNVRKLKEGGIGIFLTTSKTLDNSASLRNWVTREGESDFIGAYRLNVGAFKGADVTTDVIIIRKRIGGVRSKLAIDVKDVTLVKSQKFEIDKKDRNETKEIIANLQYNKYYIDNPQFMSGIMDFGFNQGNTHFGGIPAHLYPSQPQLRPYGKEEIKQTFNHFISDIENRINLSEEKQKTKEETIEPIVHSIESNPSNELFAEEFVIPQGTKIGSLILNRENQICLYMADPYDSNIRRLVPANIKDSNINSKYSRQQCLKDYIELKNNINNLIAYQQENKSNEQLDSLLHKANISYDKFDSRYGSFHKNRKLNWLARDVDFYSIAATQSIEEKINKETGESTFEYKKNDIYRKRVIDVKEEPEVHTVQDALILSYQRYREINLEYMSSKLNRDSQSIKEELILNKLAFEDPQSGKLTISHEYLSGNVRDKLEIAELYNTDSRYQSNIEELNKVLPLTIPIHLIEINLGCTWIPTSIYSDYIKETYQLNNINLVNIHGKWITKDKKIEYSATNEQTGYNSKVIHKQITGLDIFMAAINNNNINLRKNKEIDTEGERILTNMIDDVKINFNTWVKDYLTNKNTELGEKVEKLYNDNYNNYVPLEISESFLPESFYGQSNIDLYLHQKKAVIRGTMQPLLFAHEVGTGKTFTLIASAMEMRRLGISRKPMIAVQNATYNQFISDAKLLYPGSKILTLPKSTPEERKTFYNAIRYNDWDLIIVPHSVLDKIPDSIERQQNYINTQINELSELIYNSKQQGIDEKDLSSLNQKLEKLNKELYETTAKGELDFVNNNLSIEDIKEIHYKRINNRTVALEESLDRNVDDIELNFDQLGIDALLVDEAHNYKRLGYDTTIPNGVKGIDTAQSKRAVSLYLKIQSVLEKGNGKNVLLATGTPISNTCAELWTFLRYLSSPNLLEENNMRLFDEFVMNYGLIRPELEFTPTGKYKQVNRLGSYTNIPELMRVWQQYTDTVLTKELNYINDKVPRMKNGRPSDVFFEPTTMTRLILQKLAEKGEWFEQLSGDDKKQYRHIPLVLYSLAKRACIDPRLIVAEEQLPADLMEIYKNRDKSNGVQTKTEATIEYVLKTLKETSNYNGTIAIFCDNYRRSEVVGIDKKGKEKKAEKFNLFKEIKEQLIQRGINKKEICIMSSDMDSEEKQKIFDEVQLGNIRVIMGTTALLGTGVNIQNRLYAVVHMDAPVRPMDYQQRNGRILRQGNKHKDWGIDVDIVRYGVMRTMDTTAYQVLKNKSKFVEQVMNNKEYLKDPLTNRIIEEESTEYDRPTAVLSGSQYYILAEQAKKDYNRLLAREKQHNSNQVAFTDKVRKNDALIKTGEELIKHHQEVINKLNSVLGNSNTIESVTFDDTIVKVGPGENILSSTLPETNNIVESKDTLFNIDTAEDEQRKEAKSILAPIYNKINKQVVAETTSVRENGNITEHQMDPCHLKLNDNIDVILKYKFKREVKLTSSSYKVEVHRTLHYDIPQLDIYNTPVSGAQSKAAIEDIIQNVLTGGDSKEKIVALENSIRRMQQENDTKRPLIGIEFPDKDKIKNAKEKYDKYSSLATKEIKDIQQKNMEALDGIPPLEINIDDLLKISDETEEPTKEFQSLEFNVYHADSKAEDLEIASELILAMRKAGINVELSYEDSNYYGYTQNNNIVINARELNFETPIHEYSHIWCKAMQQKNPELWKEIKEHIMELHMLKYPEAKKALSSLSEEKQELAKDLATSELIARYSGRSGAIKLHNEYRRIKDKGQKGYICDKVFTNVLNSLNKFWNWTAKNIFGKKENNTFDVIADTILCEMLSGPKFINLDKKQDEKIEKTKNEINDKPLEKHIKEIINKKKHRGFKM